MVYFPEHVFSHITSYLLDPEYYKRKHAEVWQTIRVMRCIEQFSYDFDDTGVEQDGLEHHFYIVGTKQYILRHTRGLLL